MATARKAPAAKNTEPHELNLETKVTLRSIADWNTGFSRKSDGVGDVMIAPKGTVRLSRNEIISQVQSGNKLISGIDGLGNHATLIIEDEDTRKEVGFENQVVFSDDLVKKVFNIDKQEQFEEEFQKSFVTRAEKFAVMDAIGRLGINNYKNIRFAESYTGINV